MFVSNEGSACLVCGGLMFTSEGPWISSGFLYGLPDFLDYFSGKLMRGGLQKNANFFTWTPAKPALFGNAFVEDVTKSW